MRFCLVQEMYRGHFSRPLTGNEECWRVKIFKGLMDEITYLNFDNFLRFRGSISNNKRRLQFPEAYIGNSIMWVYSRVNLILSPVSIFHSSAFPAFISRIYWAGKLEGIEVSVRGTAFS